MELLLAMLLALVGGVLVVTAFLALAPGTRGLALRGRGR